MITNMSLYYQKGLRQESFCEKSSLIKPPLIDLATLFYKKTSVYEPHFLGK